MHPLGAIAGTCVQCYFLMQMTRELVCRLCNISIRKSVRTMCSCWVRLQRSSSKRRSSSKEAAVEAQLSAAKAKLEAFMAQQQQQQEEEEEEPDQAPEEPAQQPAQKPAQPEQARLLAKHGLPNYNLHVFRAAVCC